MSYEDEKLAIYQRLCEKLDAACEADKDSHGMDGIGSLMTKEAVQEYNRALLALKKKYNREINREPQGADVKSSLCPEKTDLSEVIDWIMEAFRE